MCSMLRARVEHTTSHILSDLELDSIRHGPALLVEQE